jgi:trehalose-6-phosphate synthase
VSGRFVADPVLGASAVRFVPARADRVPSRAVLASSLGPFSFVGSHRFDPTDPVREVRLDAEERGGFGRFSNRVLWILHHGLIEPVGDGLDPVGDQDAWASYVSANCRFADVLAEEADRDTMALVHGHRLMLVPMLLRARRPDVPIAHLWRIPFAPPEDHRAIPHAWTELLLQGLLGADAVRFRTVRSSENFVACCRHFLGARYRHGAVVHQDGRTEVRVEPIGSVPAPP